MRKPRALVIGSSLLALTLSFQYAYSGADANNLKFCGIVACTANINVGTTTSLYDNIQVKLLRILKGVME